MKKNLLTVALLVSFFQSKAQLTTVAPGAVMTVRPGTLVYNGGGLKTVGDGKVDNYGNFMIVGGATTDKFETFQANGTSPKLNGGNFNLLYDNATATSPYGQLYITNLRQADITAIVDKQYRATANGTFQQMALPFYNKRLSGTYVSADNATESSTLSFDLGTTGFSNLRNTNSIGYWENQRVLMHNIPNTSTTTLTKAAADIQTVLYNNAARYYAVGAANWNPAVLHTIKGVPFSDNNNPSGTLLSTANPLNYTLRGAGYTLSGSVYSPIAYGVGTGNNNNGVYNEQYKTYLQDAFAITDGAGFYNGLAGAESGNFGRNMYQFGNPFLTNIDLSRVGYDEDGAGTGDDGNAITSIRGIRYESLGVVTSNLGATSSTQYKYVTYDTSGIPAGDFEGAVIKPMQAFVIKLRNNTTDQNIIFNSLRRFASTTRAASTPYSLTAAKNGNTLKQLRIIGLDTNGDEVMRTYYVVGANLSTGRLNDVKLQAAAFSGALSTREELPSGGEDTVANGLYWLYINEANEIDYLGKKIRMNADLTKITSFKFELAEDAVALSDGQSTFVNGNNSFYIEQTPGTYTQISHNQILPATAVNSGLYYGLPNSGTLATNEAIIKDDGLVIAFEKESNTHQVIFPKSWNKATVTIFDVAGRKIFTQKDIFTKNNFVLPLSQNGAYLVECESEKGVKVVKKVIK
ncbi:T9SS type A sorting domain-containing protein [Chryseobacterium aquaticum]|uniref:T9SS type A sorting domain-containing protein n=1 Tax=Chryseobacterium aquaticum TaxID=452084 RepID=A0A848NB77_9FLAO|nr:MULTISPECIES: T9SS type A sorting domain-containing protein [Chryseobacterium]NMR35810.1 T9SS type A sorting domain-containing protein [Chryseobacterium aquaticum]NRQ47941.1 T9SS type A sorting domain-containing protein [Chryseobacterium sp. C-204]